MPDRGPERGHLRSVGERPQPGEKPTDVGRTMGGGSLGHAPAEDVAAEGEIRNNPPAADADDERLRRDHGERERNAADAERPATDPVMPPGRATLNTKI